MNLDLILDQLANIYDELDSLPKTTELREALSAVSDLGILLDRIQQD